ncbi:MAG TPA: AI-2E family transporter [Bacteroidales bacterium]|jgi:predicted PurR-regulated permease PerM|nr:AI-2E family transporter [Bacteroidales bacterium]
MSVNIHTHATTNKLLLFIVVPLVFYILKTLNFIFIPLFGALLVALLFLPLMRYFSKKEYNKMVSISIIISIISLLLVAIFIVMRMSAREILSADQAFWDTMMKNLNKVLVPVIEIMGIEKVAGEDNVSSLLHSEAIVGFMSGKIGPVLIAIRQTVVMLLMAVFFLLLLMAGSINVQKVMENTIFKKRIPSMKTFVILEKSIVKFIVVKFLISLATGISFSIACVSFGIPFPVFWGTMAFLLNFIQMVGSIVITIVLSVFGIALLPPGLGVVAFIFILIAIQILFGSVLEPIFMGKTFSINTITILIMILLWGYIWGVPGLIFSVPITVALKTILEQFPKTRIIAQIMS